MNTTALPVWHRDKWKCPKCGENRILYEPSLHYRRTDAYEGPREEWLDVECHCGHVQRYACADAAEHA